ncbi:Phenylacetic acid catabolic protein [Salsipaludibacter albus]|uniref:Phenylacetic acid catabolic protein n=1 Tax=Salsipaludibacter albus TaxID=2849650 RepID=UPI001EE4CC5A|nr:Phenylacetic acid catabolic protein [Salsipaludibacter albus]MBY5163237.1 phenylacetate-CoA oxygenase subunit PaaI [Salsipaludibacter albus]
MSAPGIDTGTTDTDVTGPLDDDAVVQGLVNLLVVIGDNKYFLGRHLSKWSVGAPGLEAAVAVAAISQGHLGQARALFPFVDELAGEYTIIGTPDTGRERRYNMACLDDEFASWPRAVATLFLVDPALDIILRALNETQEELARRIGRVLEESRFHADFARGRLAHLLATYPNARDEFLGDLRTVLVEVLAWFGPPGEAGVEAMKDAGVLALDNDQMRTAWLDHVGPVLVEQGLADALGIGGGPGDWTHPEVPWDRFDALQRRLET